MNKNDKKYLNILFINDNDSRFSLFRGETIFKEFCRYYEKTIDISYSISTSKRLYDITVDELMKYNVLWLDNICDYKAAINLSNLLNSIFYKIDPNWKENFLNNKENKEYIKSIFLKRKEIIKIIYALDEFVWQAPFSRSKELNKVKIIESLMDLSDVIVTPNYDLADFIQNNEEAKWVGFVRDDHDVRVIPSTVNPIFFQLYKNFNRDWSVPNITYKPKVLVKGLRIPDNVKEFIIENYKKMNITISSVDYLNDDLMKLINDKKINHIMHWANPNTNKKNIVSVYALERDFNFDFVIHTKPPINELKGDIYEITSGDEDILASIAFGSIPICQTQHIGYDEEHLSNISGFVFDPDTPPKYLKNIITSLCESPVKFNESFNKCFSIINKRISISPLIMALYLNVFIGNEQQTEQTEQKG